MALASRKKRLVFQALAVIMAFSLVAACSSDSSDDANKPSSSTTAPAGGENETDEPDEPGETPEYGGKVVVGLEAETNSYQPAWGTFGNSGMLVARSFFDPIAARGGDGEIYPFLAESIEPNDDLTEWTVTLRPDIKFHDGTPLDAETVKANFEEYLTADGARTIGTLAVVKELRVDDELTYTYVLENGNAAFPDLLTGVVGMPFSIEACRAAGEACGDQPVGTGPFIVDRWQRDNELVVKRNPDYWRTDDAGNQLPYLDEIVFRPIPDEDTRFQAVRSGDHQVGQTLRQTAVRMAQEAAERGEIQSFQALGNNGGSNIYNTGIPPTDDVRVRRAMAYALNQSALVAVLGGEGISPNQTQFFSPDSPWYSDKVAAAWPTNDLEKGRELLEEYVNDPDRSDGKAAGAPVTLELMCPPDPSAEALAQGYQSMWKEIGIDVTIATLEQAIIVTRVIGGPDTTPPFLGDFQTTCFRAGGESDPYTTLKSAFGNPASEPANVSNYWSEDLAEQLEILRSNTDFSTRYAAVEAIGMELAENVPFSWTGSTATSLFTTNDVRNLERWTIPGGIAGNGVIAAESFWTEVWLAK